jgi:hypothetical protein
MVPPPDSPAELGFDAVGAGVYVHLLGGVRTGSDFGVTSTTNDILQKGQISVVEATLWGDPTNPGHDTERGLCVTSYNQTAAEGCPSVERRDTPFLTLPSACSSSLKTPLALDTWQEPGNFLSQEALINAGAASVEVSGCERLPFDPTAAISPSEPEAAATDSPSGLEVHLKVPQEESVNGLAESDVKDVVVSFPPGMTVSPSAANSLGACSPSEVQLHTEGLVGSCPDAAKIGSAEIVTPLLEKPLRGALYVAQQGNAGAAQGSNPFDSLLAVYLIAEASGVRLKLAGHVEADPATGQLTVRFEGNPPDEGEPQLPFSDLKIKLFGGPRAALSTPSTCGTYQTSTSLTPWSGGASVNRLSSFQVSSDCANGFAPSLLAGTTSAQAGAFSTFKLNLSRQDGEQDVDGLEATLPPGLLAKLAGVSLCADAQANAGACPATSRIGSVTVGAGPGADPVYVTGGVYLTGPYNGGAFGEVVEVPAIAGPFNLGNVVVRGSIRINPATAQASILSNPFPTILQGIPLQVKTVSVTLDRPTFTFNPTNCTAMSVTGTVTSTQGAKTAVSDPFEATNCATLPFKPSFSASTQGNGTTNGNGASLTVKISTKQGPSVPTGSEEANIKKVDVSLPHALSSRLKTLQKACPAATFEANPANCPPDSDVGTATASTPLLNASLTGPAYLVSHGGEAFPDLVLVLQGENVTIVLTGNTDIKKGITYSKFEAVPDAPVSSFELNLPEKQFALLGAIKNLCKPTKSETVKTKAKKRVHGKTVTVIKKTTKQIAEPLIMPTTITGQNGAVLTQSTKIGVTGCKKPPAKKAAKKKAAKKK